MADVLHFSASAPLPCWAPPRALYHLAIDRVLALITQQRIPIAVQSQEISRHAERIASAAPALLTITTKAEKDQWSRAIDIEVATLNELLAQLKQSGVEGAAVQVLGLDVERMRNNLQSLDQLVNASWSSRPAGLVAQSYPGTSDQGLLAPGFRLWASALHSGGAKRLIRRHPANGV